MNRNSRLIVTGFFCLVIFWIAASAQAREATIEDIIITNTTKDLLLYCSIKNCFTEEMNRAIIKGVPTTFTFHVQLYKDRSYFLDKEIAEIKINHTIKYDALKNEFLLTLGSKKNSSTTVKEFFKAKRLLTELNGVKLASLDQMERGRQYYLRIKVKLNKVRLPYYLHYILFFVSLWDFETDWHEAYFSF